MTSPDSNSNRAAFFAGADSLRWDGHMSDGVAATSGFTPGAELCANAEALWLKGARGDFFFHREGMMRIRRGGMYPWFFTGVRLQHRVGTYPEDIGFKPLAGNTRALLAQLQALGWPVK